MSLIPHGYFSRSKFDVDNWMHQTLEHFDPYDELDHMLGSNMHWLNRPSFMEPIPLVPKVPEKYRITVDCAGYNPKSLKTEYRDGKLYVTGREEIKNHDDDYSIREFKKSYALPQNAEIEKLVSFYAGGHLVIEVPLKTQKRHIEEDLFPKLVDNKDGSKEITMTCSVPEGIDPAKVSVTCKDRDLIIKAEDKIEKPDSMTRMYYYKRCTFPENTDFKALKCHFDNHKLLIEAPINSTLKYHRHVPIEYHPDGIKPAIEHHNGHQNGNVSTSNGTKH